ncbi:DUF2239 family protein [Chelatococcus sp. GCM10030263]|uniref:DUF2239 family protein n=1 Tax=Chelatococcus sp. GCM10030263 TaxID=3273387 RepID=UPI003615DA33
MTAPSTYTAFDGSCRIASGPLPEVTLAVKQAIDGGAAGPVLTYDDATGRVVDLDINGAPADAVARVTPEPDSAEEPATAGARGRGRPKLGVVAREVTLLPRHWEWLNSQPGGASVALRKLVEEARRVSAGADRLRQAREAAYHFMAAAGGDLPGYEEAIRALFAGDRGRVVGCLAAWPPDLRDHALKLGFPDEREAA